MMMIGPLVLFVCLFVCLFGWLVGVFTKELKWIVAVFVNSRYAKNKKQKNTKTVRHWKLCQHRQ